MFKDKFIEMLQKSGKTAKEISQETGIKESSISDYKKGNNQPTVNNLIKLSEYFNCSVDYLLDRSEEPKRINNSNIQNSGGMNTVNINNKNNEELSHIDLYIIDLLKDLEIEDKADIIKEIAQKKKK